MISPYFSEKRINCSKKIRKETERLIADISHQLKTPITSLRMTNESYIWTCQAKRECEFLDNMQADLLKIEWFVKNDFEPCKIRFKDTYIEKRRDDGSRIVREDDRFVQNLL